MFRKLYNQSQPLFKQLSFSGGPKSKDFWPTIKPFLLMNAIDGGYEVILSEQDKIVLDQPEVCEIFNNYFVSVAKDICNVHVNDKYKEDFSDHPSILNILENTTKGDSDIVSFRPVKENCVSIRLFLILM